MQTDTDVSSEDAEPLTGPELVLGLLAGLWMVVGLFLDGWAHDDGRPESFFTPWHGVLYSGFVAGALVAVEVVRRRWRPGLTGRRAVPPGHGLTLVGLGGFAVGALGDLLWHETFGIEVGAEALLSPTHLVLLVSGLLVLSAPLRLAAPIDRDTEVRLRDVWPVVVDLALLAGVAGFFVAYLSPFVNDAVSQAFDPSGEPHDHPSTDVEELQQLLGLASILVTSIVFAVPLLVLAGRWRTPPGTGALLAGLVGFFLVGVDEFDEWFVVIAAVLAGVVIDHATPRVGAALGVGAGVAVLWSGYFILHALVGDPVAWSADLVGGAIVSSALLVAAVGWVSAQARPASASRSSVRS